MKEKVLDMLASNLLNVANLLNVKVPERARLGNYVDIRMLQERIIPLMLSPGDRDLRFFAGKLLGNIFGAKTGIKTLTKAADIYAKLILETKYAKPEIIKISAEETVIRFHESACAFGLGNIGMKIDSFEEGFQTGFFSSVTGQRMFSVETKCLANGDPYCEFKIKKTTISQEFTEAFKI